MELYLILLFIAIGSISQYGSVPYTTLKSNLLCSTAVYLRSLKSIFNLNYVRITCVKKTCIFHHCRAVTKIHSCTVCTWYIAKQLCTYKLTLIISLFSLQINFDLIIMIFNVRIWNEMLTISVCLASQ